MSVQARSTLGITGATHADFPCVLTVLNKTFRGLVDGTADLLSMNDSSGTVLGHEHTKCSMFLPKTAIAFDNSNNSLR